VLEWADVAFDTFVMDWLDYHPNASLEPIEHKAREYAVETLPDDADFLLRAGKMFPEFIEGWKEKTMKKRLRNTFTARQCCS
jgi:acyl carrier protein phosphodiesterase